jgi:hypothetical protein
VLSHHGAAALLWLQEPYLIPDTVPAMMRRVDADGDGSMSFEEFLGLLQVSGRRTGAVLCFMSLGLLLFVRVTGVVLCLLFLSVLQVSCCRQVLCYALCSWACCFLFWGLLQVWQRCGCTVGLLASGGCGASLQLLLLLLLCLPAD